MLPKVFSIGYNLQCVEKLLCLLIFVHVVFLYGFLSIIKLCFPWFKFSYVAFPFLVLKNAKYYLDRTMYCSSTACVYLLITFFQRLLSKEQNNRALKTFNAVKKLFYNNYIRNNVKRNSNNAAFVTRNNDYSYNGIHFLLTYLIRLILVQLFYHKLLGSSLAACCIGSTGLTGSSILGWRDTGLHFVVHLIFQSVFLYLWLKVEPQVKIWKTKRR